MEEEEVSPIRVYLLVLTFVDSNTVNGRGDKIENRSLILVCHHMK